MASPFGKGQIIASTTWAEGAKSCQQRKAIASDSKGWMARYRLLRTYLGLADAQEVFFVPMIDLNLPAIEIGLNQFNHQSLQIGSQQVSRLAVVSSGVLEKLIRQ